MHGSFLEISHTESGAHIQGFFYPNFQPSIYGDQAKMVYQQCCIGLDVLQHWQGQLSLSPPLYYLHHHNVISHRYMGQMPMHLSILHRLQIWHQSFWSSSVPHRTHADVTLCHMENKQVALECSVYMCCVVECQTVTEFQMAFTMMNMMVDR